MKIKPFIYKSEGMGIALWLGKRYFSFWIIWADGLQTMLNGSQKTLWRFPYIRVVNQKFNLQDRS